MKQSRRVWSTEQKLQILQEADEIGLTELFKNMIFSRALYHRCKRVCHKRGLEGHQSKRKAVDTKLNALQNANERLERIISNQALELEFKTEFLKKPLKQQEAVSFM